MADPRTAPVQQLSIEDARERLRILIRDLAVGRGHVVLSSGAPAEAARALAAGGRRVAPPAGPGEVRPSWRSVAARSISLTAWPIPAPPLSSSCRSRTPASACAS